MPITLNLGNDGHIPESEGLENVLKSTLSENQAVESKQSIHETELPRGKGDARVHKEAMPQFQKIGKSYNQPSSSFKIHKVTKDWNAFISAMTSSQEAFDKWVKMNAEFTQNQIELERQNTRIKDAQEKRKSNFLQEMKEVQEMKKKVMSYYESLAKK